LYIENGLAATSDFTIAGAQQGAIPQVFTNLHFTTANTATDALSATPISTFPSVVTTLYLLFDWDLMAPGTLWKMTWSVDGDKFYEQVVPWNASESGQNYLFRFLNPSGIPDGTYSVELSVNNIVLAKTQAQVGIGQLPIDRFAQASGVQMRGQILDADTHRGIPGVTFILISAEFSVGEFNWDQNKVYAMAVTDQNGFFEIDRPLELSTTDKPVAYSAIIAADGYLPISADGITVDDKTENPLNMVIHLTHD
jgi:hypothetical protein